MTPLKQSLIKQIKADGPISIAAYMAACLFHPNHGYYVNENPFGAEGDFITAPDISQMFGELTAAWLIEQWRAQGSPAHFTLCEIGPGRGTWMHDILRTITKAEPAMLEKADVVLIEKSEQLKQQQAQKLSAFSQTVKWHDDIADLKRQPTLFIANELFDALPVRQFVKTKQGWLERMVDIDAKGELIFTVGSASIDTNILPLNANAADDGSIFEYAPAREALMQNIATHINAHNGCGLFVDYGYAASSIGDTLQAVRNHAPENTLASPGKADLTSHVDFEALSISAHSAGAKAHPVMTQADFLLALGLVERAGILGAGKDKETQNAITQEVHRLAGNDANQMGELFKVLCLTQKTTPTPIPFTDNSTQS